MPRTKAFDEAIVLEKAVDLFWEKGFHATSMADLVERLGINRASIYDTFGNKKALFQRALAHYQTTNSITLQQMLHTELDIRTGLRRMMRLAIEESLTDLTCKGCFVVNTTTELLPGDPVIQEIVVANKTVFEEGLQKYLEYGVKNGQIAADKDLKAIVALIYIYQNGLRVVTKAEADRDQLIATSEALLSLLD